jgi:carnitine O-octanoyltransferase
MNFPHDNILTEEDNFTLLRWKLDQNMLEKIHEAKSTRQQMCNSLVLTRKPFLPFGKNGLVRINVNPDTFVQMAIQLAYIRLHKKPGILYPFVFTNHTYIFLALSAIEIITYTFVYAAPTYETATTRKFRYGRTETLRQGFIDFDSYSNKMP